jgi:hypothetical protein
MALSLRNLRRQGAETQIEVRSRANVKLLSTDPPMMRDEQLHTSTRKAICSFSNNPIDWRFPACGMDGCLGIAVPRDEIALIAEIGKV